MKKTIVTRGLFGWAVLLFSLAGYSPAGEKAYGIVSSPHPLLRSSSEMGDLEIHTIDVGQGASELIIGPDGTSILIDGGTGSKGYSEVVPYLNAIFPAGSRRLDYVIASHDDNDHYGGLISVLSSGYTAETIYHCGENYSFGLGEQIPLGLEISLGDGARATCVGRYGQFIDGSSGSTGSNNLSICLLIQYCGTYGGDGGFDYITAGDLEGNESYLSNALITYPPASPLLDPDYGVDVIHVNHHGSDGSSSATYVNRLKAELAVINGGTNYGHPRWTAVDRLKGRSSYSDGSGATGVTWSGATQVYRTTYDVVEDGRAPEWDCPTLGDMVLTYDGCSENYYLNGSPFPVDFPCACYTPTPTPEGYHTPPPTPTSTPTSTPPPTLPPTPSVTPTPSVSPTPEGYKTPTPPPSATPTGTHNPTPPPTATPPSAGLPFADGFESGTLGQYWSVYTDLEGRVRIEADYPYEGTYSALLDTGISGGDDSTAALILTADLSGYYGSEVALGFWWREFDDDNDAADGVFVSDDYGASWDRILSFNYGPQSYTYESISLSEMRGVYGFDFNEHVQVKFQFYDNFRIPTDGYAIDEVRIWAVTPTPVGFKTPLPTSTLTPTVTTTPTVTPTPSATPTPEGFKSPTPTPSATPTPTVTTTPPPTATPPAAALPFYDGFETGGLSQCWSVFTDAEGRVRVSTAYPDAGAYSVLLDDSSNGGQYSPAALILTADLSGCYSSLVSLEFRWREFIDEEDEEDGVFVSDDYGENWDRVFSFKGGPGYYTSASVILSEMRGVYGFDFNDHFQIKFQFYDNYPIPSDGYALDEIEVWAVTPTPSPTVTVTPSPPPTVPPPTPTPTVTGTPSPRPTAPPPTSAPTASPTPSPGLTPVITPTPTIIKCFRVSGRVVDIDTGAVISGAAVRAACPDRVSAVAAAGDYGDYEVEVCTHFGDGTVRAQARRPGYLPGYAEAPYADWAGESGVAMGDIELKADSISCPGIVSGDYNGDGTPDIAIFRPSSGLWAIRGMSRTYFGTSQDVLTPADYSGDGIVNIAVFRPSAGLWAISGLTRIYFGGFDDIPVPGDYEGTGTAAVGIFRPSSGLWAIRGGARMYFGGRYDQPIPGDYQGAGRQDPAIFRAESGLWAIRAVSRFYFGAAGDRLVPGDYTGWFYRTAGIFRPASGLWAIRAITRVYFGKSGDSPVPADYRGSASDLFGIFRGTSGLWAIKGVTRTYFGGTADIPVTR